MKSPIISCLVILCFLSFNGMAGTSIVGTRFIINEKTKRLSIKIINDNENDYLIQTAIANNTNDRFVISPPLFVLLKNQSNIITIISNNIENTDTDHLYKLSIASIPKSTASVRNTIGLAVRANFHLIYRHADLKTADFNQLKLIKHKDNAFYLKNDSKFVFSMFVSKSKGDTGIKKTISPNEEISVDDLCKQYNYCSLWVSFIDDNESIIKQVSLSVN